MNSLPRIVLIFLGSASVLSCAVGEGAFPMGAVEVSIEPEGSLTEGVVPERLELNFGHFHWVPAEGETEEAGGHHGHAHLISALGGGPANPADHGHGHDTHDARHDALDHSNDGAHHDDHDPIVFNLLGPTQIVSKEELRKGIYDTLVIEAETSDDDEGCALSGSGTFAIEEESVPWELCLALTSETVATLPMELEVEEGETSSITLHFHRDRLFKGLSLPLLHRGDDGTIRIGKGANGGAVSLLQANLASAFAH